MPLPNRILASGPLVTLGGIAYSLYLWHWPLLIFWLSLTGHTHADVFEGSAILAVSVVLAYLTLRFVEEPLRVRAMADGVQQYGHVPGRSAAVPRGGAPGYGGRRWRSARRWYCWASR